METKFIHCADSHLGCKPAHLDIRYNDFFNSFKKLVEDAIANECKYILIAGDLFHLKAINSKTLLNVIELLELAKSYDIKVIVIEGNHDKAYYVDQDSWLEFLKAKEYIILLKHQIIDNELVIDDSSIYEDENIRVIGIGYLGSTTQMYLNKLNKKISKSNKFTVLMLHAAVNRLCGTDMGDINSDILKPLSSVVNYIALGHIHSRYEYNDLIYNPGSLENVRLTDARGNKDKGYYLVSFDEKKKKEVTFIPSIHRTINNINLEIEDLSLQEVIDYIKNYEFSLESDSMLELTLYGKVKFNPYTLNLEEIKVYIKEKYNLLYIEMYNYINIITEQKNMENNIDIAYIEKDIIKDYLKRNYPEVNKIKLADEIVQVKEQLLNDIDKESIINNLIKEEDKLWK